MERHNLDDVALDNLIHERLGTTKNRVEALRQVFNELAAREVLNDVKRIDVFSRFYHWWQEPAQARFKVDRRLIVKLINKRVEELEANSLRDLILNKLNLPPSRYAFYKRLYHERREVTALTLKRLCDDMNFPYGLLEKLGVFIEPKFPLDLNSQSLWFAAFHIVNEGAMTDPRRFIFYTNRDPVLHHYFRQAVVVSGGSFYGPYLTSKEILISKADALTGRKISSLGMPYGSKVRRQPTINLSRLDDDTWGHYVRTLLTEEGSCHLTLRRGRLIMGVSYGRSIDITELLPRSFVEWLEYEKYYSINEVRDRKLQRIIRSCPPNLMVAEYNELIRRHSRHLSVDAWPDIKPHVIHKSKRGRVTVHWRFRSEDDEIVELFRDYYGMLPGTWKALALEVRRELFRRLSGKDLSADEVRELARVREVFPAKVPDWWVRRKSLELFNLDLDEAAGLRGRRGRPRRCLS